MSDIVERLKKRADEDEACAVNSEAVAEALAGQMALFEQERGQHNTYAVRVHLDHRNGARRDRRYAADLKEAIADIERLRAELSSLRADRPFVMGCNEGFEAGIDQAAQVAETGDWYGQFQTAGDERRARAIAGRIRALKSKEGGE